MPIFQSVLQWFQFTHPGRGATEEDAEIEQHNFVSIHAPREGCDSKCPQVFTVAMRFQFTHPGRGATPSWLNARWSGRKFQFTHPGRGATALRELFDKAD